MTQYDLASFLRLFALLVLLAPALIFMLRNRRQSVRHLAIWLAIAIIATVIAFVFAAGP